MRAYLVDLIDRVARDDMASGSASSESWAAHREAEALTDPSMADELVAHALTERSKDRRSACCFVIGKIGGNLEDPRCARLLLELLAREKDKYVIASILDRVGEIPKPGNFDLSPVYGFLGDARWLVRHSAIQALDNSKSDEVETRLLLHLQATDDPYDRVRVQSVLGRVGTSRSIPFLEPSLKSSKRDVRLSADMALQAIRAREGE